MSDKNKKAGWLEPGTQPKPSPSTKQEPKPVQVKHPGKTKTTPPTAASTAVMVILFVLLQLLQGRCLAQDGWMQLGGTSSTIYTNRLLATIADSGTTNRLYFTNASAPFAAFGNTNAIHIRTNATTARWEWHTDWSTRIATNDANRPTGTWRTVTISPTVYGYTRYEPKTVSAIPTAPGDLPAGVTRNVSVDTNGAVTDSGNFFDALSPLLSARTVYVAKNGKTNWPGTMLYPKPAITNGLDVASIGDTVFVNPGTYAENDVVRPGIPVQGMLGAKLLYIQTATNSSVAGIGDDRFRGAGNYTFHWPDKITYIGFSNYTLIDEDTLASLSSSWPFNIGTEGVFVFTNANTLFDVQVGDVEYQNYVAYGFEFGAFLGIGGCNSNSVFRAKSFTVVGPEAITDPLEQSYGSSANGIVWDAVTCHVFVDRINKIPNYAFYGKETHGTPGANVSDFYFTGDFVYGRNYTSCSSPEYRNWYNIKYQRGLSLGAIGLYGSGKHYFYIDKLENINVGMAAIEMYAGAGKVSPKAWFYGEKLTGGRADGGGLWLDNHGGQIDINFQQYEDAGVKAGFVTSYQNGVTNEPLTYINGGRATVTNGPLVVHTGGTLQLRDISLNNSAASTNAIVIVTNGLSLKGVTIKAPLGKQSITNFTTGTHTVGIYWSAGTETNSPKVTVSPNAGWTVDAAVK